MVGRDCKKTENLRQTLVVLTGVDLALGSSVSKNFPLPGKVVQQQTPSPKSRMLSDVGRLLLHVETNTYKADRVSQGCFNPSSTN